MQSLCEYRDILGKPNEGFHTHIFGFAFFDLLATIVIAGLITYFIKAKKVISDDISFSLSFGIILLVLIGVGELLHKQFCVTK